MKKIHLLMAFIGMFASAQSQNVFPTTGNVGIGTTLPAYPLDVHGNAHISGQIIIPSTQPFYLMGSGTETYTVSAIYNSTSYFKIDIARLTNSSSGTPIDFILSGRGGQEFIVRTGNTGDYSFNDNTGNSLLKINGTGNVGIGTTSPQSKLAVNGTITAKQITVNQTGWSDFVFDSAYNLKPLSQVEKYIHLHKHLSNIPPSDTIASQGLDLAEMQKKQMQKIEELTLYMIQQNKIINNQQKIIDQLSERLELLENKKVGK